SEGKVSVPSTLRFLNGSTNVSIVGGYDLSFDDVTANNFYLVFNYGTKALQLINHDPNLNNRKFAVVGVISKTLKTAYIIGDYKIEDDGERSAFSPFNATLSTMRTNLIIDFPAQKLVVNNSGRPWLAFENVEGGIINFQDAAGEYSFAES